MKDHGKAVVEHLKSVSESWPKERKHLITPTEKSYYLDFVDTATNTILRYRIDPNLSPQEVGESISIGSLEPIKTFAMVDEMSTLASIRALPRSRRRKHMRAYRKQAYRNGWAYDVREALKNEEE